MKPADVVSIINSLPMQAQELFLKDVQDLQLKLSNYELIIAVVLHELKTINTGSLYESREKLKAAIKLNAPDIYNEFFSDNTSALETPFVRKPTRPGTIDFLMRKLAESRKSEVNAVAQGERLLAQQFAEMSELRRTVREQDSALVQIRQALATIGGKE